MTLVRIGVEWWPEPMEQPADRDTIAAYDVDPKVLERWRTARDEYMSARAALVGAIERQGWRAHRPATDYVDVVFTAPPGGPDDPLAEFVEVEDDQHRAAVALAEWIERPDGYWALRIPRLRGPG